MLLAHDPIMSGRTILSFRYLECKNLSIFSDSIGTPNETIKNGKKVRRRSWNLKHIEEDSSTRVVTEHGECLSSMRS